MDFKDKVAIVTGGSKGIGRSISLLLAEQGCRVYMNYSRDEEAAHEVVQEAQGYAGEVIPLQADVTDPLQVARMIDQVEKEGGWLDILVNNVGMIKDGFLMLMGEGDWGDVVKTNLTSVYLCCRAAIRKMIPHKQGKIINISSISGIIGTAGQVNYAAAKGGVIAFTKALARELGPFNIQVNAVAPGVIETEMTTQMPPERVEAIVRLTALNRIGKPEEVAWAVLFLASKRADYITGQTIVVDGGIV
ncbi:MAG: beta-ketoacyl-ACP reductase [Deltaproteobacteria bacterium RBG_13_52_11]|nr:MAG: beta-ketoacyl-ACP reductase [Deltaproteobacteria bacterium RBG_13_52_11]